MSRSLLFSETLVSGSLLFSETLNECQGRCYSTASDPTGFGGRFDAAWVGIDRRASDAAAGWVGDDGGWGAATEGCTYRGMSVVCVPSKKNNPF